MSRNKTALPAWYMALVILMLSVFRPHPFYDGSNVKPVRLPFLVSSHDPFVIRYGHTYEVITGTIAEPPEYLYHGTSDIKMDLIIQEGLLSMTRQYVHLSSDIETALEVGGSVTNFL